VWLIAVDLRVIAVASGVALLTGVICGIVPALQMSRTDVSAALRSGGRSATAGARGSRVRQAFLISEVALAAALLVGAGIFASSFIRLVNTDMGFNGSNVLSVNPSPRLPAGDSLLQRGPSRVQIQMEEVLARVEGLPGVRSAALVAGGVPLTGSWSSQPVRVGEAEWKGADEVILKQVTADYLRTIGAQMLSGRELNAGDTSGAPAVVVLNDEAVRRYFGGRDPLGASIVIDTAPPRTIVGVVRGMRLTGPEADIRPEAYVPYAQWDEHNVAAGLVVATDGPPSRHIAPVKEVIWQVMPDAYIPDPKTMDEMFAELITQRKLNMILLSLFGGLALLIATIGVYGVLSYVVEGRRKEIGVRMALGAVPSHILSMVLSRAAVTIGMGLALGFMVAVWLERLVMAFVYRGVQRDPLVYAGAALLLVALGLLAAYVPARRAARVDPLIALRAE
jgi:putative ABC transport system permease protein